MSEERANGDNLHCFVGTCWCCGSPEGQRWRLNNGQRVRETLCRKCRDGMKYNGLGMDFEDTQAEKRIKEIDATMEGLRKERDRLKDDLHGANTALTGLSC